MKGSTMPAEARPLRDFLEIPYDALEEMNLEANTIGSKANEPSLAHLVVSVKEELEKIREQLQNIE